MRISDWSSDVCSSDLSACGYRRQIAGVPNVDEVASASEMPRVSSLRTRPRDSSVAFGCPRASCSDPQSSKSACEVSTGLRAHFRRSERTFRSEEHTSELQSLMRISYAVFCLKKKKQLNR